MANAYSHWRNTARPARFFAMDARVCLVVFLFLVHIRMWTLILMIIILVGATIMERYGLTLPVMLRRVRLFFVGAHRPALVRSARRTFVDRGGY